MSVSFYIYASKIEGRKKERKRERIRVFRNDSCNLLSTANDTNRRRFKREREREMIIILLFYIVFYFFIFIFYEYRVFR